MDRNTTIAFILIGGILVLWFYLNTPSPEQVKKAAKNDSTLVHTDTSNIIKETAVDSSKIKKQAVEENSGTKSDTINFGKYFSLSDKQAQIITIENNLVVMEISTKGANIRKYYLKKFNNWYSAKSDSTDDFYKTHVQLIDYSKGNSYNMSFVTSDGKAINTGDLVFNSDADKSHYTIPENDSLVLTFKLPAFENSYIEKKFTFYGNKYSFDSEIELVNMNTLISNNSYDLVWNNGLRFVEENSVDEANYSNASVYYGDEEVIVDASSVGEKENKDFNGRIDWVAVRNKYFATIIAPKDPAGVNGAYIEGTRENVGVRWN